MAAMEESFPRGGTRKTHKSEKTFQQSVGQDNLFDVSGVLSWEDSQNTFSLVSFWRMSLVFQIGFLLKSIFINLTC